MRILGHALAVVAALSWTAVASAQSLADVARQEAARKKAEASPSKTAAAVQPEPATPAQDQAQTVSTPSESSGTISLAEIARLEAARRKALDSAGKRGKLLTTEDVRKWLPPPPAAATDTSSQATDAQKAGKDKAAEKTDAEKDSVEPPKGEEYWHGRITAAREELRRNEAFAEALQSRINALSAEFAAKDDPYQRAQVADDRQKALAELDRLNADIDKNRKAIADIEEDARRTGVPAGWIR